MKNKSNKNAIKYLISLRNEILKHLRIVINKNNFNYRTFGTDIEDYLSDVLVNYFKKENLIQKKDDYEIAPNKNYFPDFTLKTQPQLAIEYKSGNKSQNRNGKWISVKNSENDMGTLNEWPKKIDKFGGENIYYIFVIYNFNNKIKEILDVQVEPFYKFIGISGGKVLKYREKDGNLRPKDFNVISPIKTFNDFHELLKKTILYRSKRIIKKHRKIIKQMQND